MQLNSFILVKIENKDSEQAYNIVRNQFRNENIQKKNSNEELKNYDFLVEFASI